MQSQILPGRAALVDRIALQFEYGQNLIALLAPLGIGKSYLLETFLTEDHSNPSFLLAWQSVEHSNKVVHKQQSSRRVHLTALLFITLLIIGFLYKSDMTELWQDYYQAEPSSSIATALPVETVTQANKTQSDIQIETTKSAENKQLEPNFKSNISDINIKANSSFGNALIDSSSNNKLSQQANTYQAKRNSSRWWIVTYGSYSSLSDA
ncbi:hypothetical protein [Pseudoalteromonas sp.]|uniref:hypothetical protein n=1 Tax=Pseudoalteromonas sp. TaxID=53249 RepID=UPI003F9C13FC